MLWLLREHRKASASSIKISKPRSDLKTRHRQNVQDLIGSNLLAVNPDPSPHPLFEPYCLIFVVALSDNSASPKSTGRSSFSSSFSSPLLGCSSVASFQTNSCQLVGSTLHLCWFRPDPPGSPNLRAQAKTLRSSGTASSLSPRMLPPERIA